MPDHESPPRLSVCDAGDTRWQPCSVSCTVSPFKMEVEARDQGVAVNVGEVPALESSVAP